MALVPDTARFRGVSPAAEAAAYTAGVGAVSVPVPVSVPSPSTGNASTAPAPASASAAPTAPPAHVTIRVLALERARAQLAVRLAATTNIGAYRLSSYPPFVRSYRELALLAFALALRHPETIVHALPVPFPALVPPPAPSSDPDSPPQGSSSEAALSLAQHDIFLAQLAKWLQRTTSDPCLIRDAELRRFVEAEYSYSPHPPDSAAPPALRRRFNAGIAALAHVGSAHHPVDIGGSGSSSSPLGLPPSAAPPHGGAAAAAKSWAGAFFSLARAEPPPSGGALATARAVHDQDPALVSAREEVTRLELQYAQAAGAGERARQAGVATRTALVALAQALEEWAAGEQLRPVAVAMGAPHALDSVSNKLRLVAGVDAYCAARSALTLGDMLAYQSLNARAAKEALLARASIVEQHWAASQAAAQRKADAEVARGYDAERAEHALGAYVDATSSARSLGATLTATSQGLRTSLRVHSRAAHADLADALAAHAAEGVRAAKSQLTQLQALVPLLTAEFPEHIPVEQIAPPTAGAVVPSPANGASVHVTHTIPSTPRPVPGQDQEPAEITASPTHGPVSPPPAPSLASPSPSPGPTPSSPESDPYRRSSSVYNHQPHPSPFSRMEPPVQAGSPPASQGQGRPPPSARRPAQGWGTQSLYTQRPAQPEAFSFGNARFGSGSFGAAARARAAAAQGRGGSFGSKARTQSSKQEDQGQTGTQTAAAAAGLGLAASTPSLPPSQSQDGSTVPDLVASTSLLGPDASRPLRSGGAHSPRSRLSARDAARSLAGTF